MNRQDAKDAKKRQRERPERGERELLRFGRGVFLFPLFLSLVSLASWRFILLQRLKQHGEGERLVRPFSFLFRCAVQ